MFFEKKPPAPFPVANLKLPPFPHIALKVLHLTQKDDVPLNQLSTLISSDAAFASQVLMISNTCLYSPRYPVRDLAQAVAVLGMRALNGVCLTVGVQTYIGKSLDSPVMRALWRHNLATAIIGEQIAKGGSMSSAVAYTAGILHDVGRFGLGVIRPKEYSEILLSHTGPSSSILPKERKAFGVDHCELGARLAVDWDLPVEYREIITRHHSEQHSGEKWAMGQLIKIACRLADSVGFIAFPGCDVDSYDDLRGLIPESERMGLPAASEDFKAVLETKISAIEH